MRIIMFTNTYLPHVGGVARSVNSYEEEFLRRGHEVRIVAPQFEGATESTRRVLRTPAIQKFNGSDFSVRIPVPGLLADFVDDFHPHILHSHHPFLLGDSALRLAWSRRLPLVFTYHTMYEQYTHYVPINSDVLKRFVIQMSTDYCNLCTHVIAPSESVAAVLQERGVITPTTTIPTGIDMELFGAGDGRRFRRQFQIAESATVIGHVGRLAAEKNLEFLSEAVGQYLAERPNSVFLVVGCGEARESMERILREHADARQIVFAGKHTGRDLADAYAAMDVFVFSSQSETQGMVLAEAMGAGVPAVALDAPGAREIVSAQNGKLLNRDATSSEFAAAIGEVTDDKSRRQQLSQGARTTAYEFSLPHCADRMLALYDRLVRDYAQATETDPGPWDRLLGRMEIEWNLLVEKTSAIAAAAAASVETGAAPEATQLGTIHSGRGGALFGRTARPKEM
jgi:glycosyltransferase involved in cell wall biosynthesis